MRDESGSATMEIVIWLPFLVFLIILTVDASVLYFRHGEMFNVARDAARSLAAGTLSLDEVDQHVADALGGIDVDVEATDQGNSYRVTIQRGEGSLSPFAVFEAVVPNLTATVVMSKEPTP